jgi:pimeloyl-ACP methyl ester carboxylesterase
MLHAIHRVLPGLLLGALLIGTQPTRATEAPAPNQLVALGEQTLEVVVQRAPVARATLVFENGLGLTLDTWRAVLPALSDGCHLLAYNRPGIGRSTASDADVFPSDAQAPFPATERLRHLLQVLELPPPYVLVGHSLGGQFAQLFARQHPDQVAGLVLVDALPPGLAHPYAEFPWYTRAGLWLFASAPLRREIAAIHPMGERLLAQPGAFAGPVVRLLAVSDAPKAEGLIKDLMKGVVYAEDFGIWATDPERAEGRMESLYPQAEVRTLRGHHRLQEQAPEQVVAAIRAVLERLPAALGSGG